MSTFNPSEWFIENEDFGTAFAVRIRQKYHEEQSPFQKLAVYETAQFGNMLVLDGFIQLMTLDNFIYHEMLAHTAIMTHRAPKTVAIIGGGDCGTLLEALKHPTIEKVTQIDIDERVTRMSEQYFPELCQSNNDPRATLLFDDGIAWMKNAAPESLDIIIVDSTDPIGPGEGLFNQAFYATCWRALRPNGILLQQSESPLYHNARITRPMRKAMLAAGFDSASTRYFPQPCYPSGWWSCTMAGKSADLQAFRPIDQVKTRYYTAEIHKAAMATPPFLAQD